MVQMTEKERLELQVFPKIQSGYFDKEKGIAEFNISGAVCSQIFILFKLDTSKINGYERSRQPLMLNQISNTQSQFMSSSGGEIYDVENSEFEDLDNEVHNVTKKLQNEQVNVDDVKIEFSEKHTPRKAGEELNQEERRIFEGSDK